MSIDFKSLFECYNGEELLDQDVINICDWIVENIINTSPTGHEFAMTWHFQVKANQNVDPKYLLTMIYCCCALYQDHINSLNYPPKRGTILLSVGLLNYIDKHQTYSASDGSVETSARKAGAYAMLGDYHNAIKILDTGLDKVRGQIKWVPGMLSPIENMLGVKYSHVEVLFGDKALFLSKIDNHSESRIYCDLVLASVQLRGHNDFVNDRFPGGMKSFIERLHKF